MTEPKPLRCDDPMPHDPHEVQQEDEWGPVDTWNCPGRKAHTNTMIGREG